MSRSKETVHPEEDPREWLLFDIDDEDTVTAEFLKSTAQPTQKPPVFALVLLIANL